jgi:RimK family alpha-L-glutamate ligase
MRVMVLTLGDRKSRFNSEIEKELMNRGVDVFFCHPDLFSITVGTDQILRYDGETFLLPDFVLTRTGASPHAQHVIDAIEAAKIDVANKGKAIRNAVDKWRTMFAASAAGLLIPETTVLLAKRGIGSEAIVPAVLKLPTGSCGRGVVPVDKLSRLKAVVDLLNASGLRDSPILIQKYLEDRPGVDVRVIVVAGRALGAMERIAQNGEERANMAQGAKGRPVELTQEIAQIAERITAVLDLDFSGVDLLHAGNSYAICEVNSSPGVKFEDVCGINVVGKIADHIVNRLNSRRLLKA